jgi:hypothetical protein
VRGWARATSRGARKSAADVWAADGSPRLEPRAVAATLALLLHLLILSALLRVTARVVEPPPPPVATQAPNADRLRDAGEGLVSVDIRPGLSTHGLACPGSTYVGVGITADPRTQRIILVGDDTPASRAGLRHDDIVLNPEVWRDAHREGVLLRVRVLRDGMKATLTVRVGRICIG